MIRDWKMEVYWRLPVFVQEAALSLYAGHLERLYYGDGFEEWREKFKSWQIWSRADAEAWQSERLRALMELTAKRVPYYRRSWQGIEWQSVRSSGDLHILPTLHKQSLRQNERDFLVDGIDSKSLWTDQTSGTTGGALRIYRPVSMLPQWWALVEVAIRNIAGVGQDMPRAMMGSRTIIQGRVTRAPYWRFNRRWRQLYLSSYHVSRRTAADYVRALRDYGSEWITGYGSAIAALAESALEAGIKPVRLRAAIVSGDTLLPGMRKSIESFFGCKCFDSYGQCEGVSMAMECAQGRMHVIPAAGIMEILRDDGSRCGPGEVGEIVSTGLLNDAMPLIRYRVGDYAAWAEDQNCTCGNQQPIITNMEGRVDDYVITSSGRKIGRLAGFRRSPRIHSAQFVQDSPGHAFLLVRPGRDYSRKDALTVRDDILSRVGDLDIVVVEVPEIPKTPQGKTVSVVRLADRPQMRETYARLLRSASDDAAAQTGLRATS
jgi:phenylacetate-CoA ligase